MLKIAEIFVRAHAHPRRNLKRKLLLLMIGTFALAIIHFLYGERPFVCNTELINSPRPTLRPLPEETEPLACNLPKLNPFDAAIQEYTMGLIHNPQCDKHFHLVFTTDLNTTLITLRDPMEVGLKDCCYRSFTRANENGVIFKGPCHPLSQNKTVIPESVEFLKVQCKNRIGDIFGFTRLKADVEDRVSRIQEEMAAKNKNKASEQVNVILLGLDGVSHMNLIRVMPLSHSFLVKNLSAIGMSGYTKVGDNTFPNIVAMLTGLSVKELTAVCWPNSYTTFDACPFIWKNFSRAGYRTAFSEDATELGAFNLEKSGFLNPPTDYYLRPLTRVLGLEIGHAKLKSAEFCYGPRLGFQVLLNNLQSMAARMGKEKRYFHLTWSTSLSHDYLTAPTVGDRDLQATLRWLSEHLNHTVFVLMSDHGIRYGGIRSTLQGQVEERMPFLYFVLPPWLSEKYGDAVRNLKSNGDKLTSPFDLYATLLDLLDLSNLEDEEIESRSQELRNKLQTSVPRGISLFLPVPSFRTCPQAGIDDHWCVCNDMESISTEEDAVMESAAIIVQELNRLLSPHPACAVLTLNETVSAKALKTKSYLDFEHSVLTVVLSTSPGNALFEATVTKTGQWWARQVSVEISRINLYGEQSWCVSDYRLKKFCYCLTQM